MIIELVLLTVIETNFIIKLDDLGQVDVLGNFVDAQTGSDATYDYLIDVVLFK